MTDALNRYLAAAERPNTQRSYASAIRHFEVEAGCFLPATVDSVAQYLARYAPELSLNTLRQRLAALARWHADHGFVDPTRAPIVKQALKGIAALHPATVKQAVPLQLKQLTKIVAHLDDAIARATDDRSMLLRAVRDRALVLLGFWRGFRRDELVRLEVQHMRMVDGKGMSIFLPRSKGDRDNIGRSFKVPALSRLCPVAAVSAWIAEAGLTDGPLFRRIDRWGEISAKEMHVNSVVPLLRRVFTDAQVPQAEQYSGHSLRRGFAGWANDNGWDVKALMEYVGWKDIHSAIRYIDSPDPFERMRIDKSLQPAAPELPAPR
ncbi:MAG: tyrosine-type recombinase/integrase [Acidobacteriota bacterium]|nr:tyrosine-type recombinase/integrase [Acidobacteriota bacterium]